MKSDKNLAATIMNLTYIARLKPELPSVVYFEEAGWELLYRAVNKTQKTPKRPYTIGEAVHYLGQLGGPKRAGSQWWPAGGENYLGWAYYSIPYLPTANGWRKLWVKFGHLGRVHSKGKRINDR